MAIHELKTWPEYYQAVVDGTKTFEVRKDDRGFQVGDTLVLREWETWPEDPELLGDYTGRECHREVTYILHGPAFGLDVGYCVMGIREVERVASNAS